MSNPFHQKKLRLALRGLNNPEPGSELDVMWVCSWLDDIGLPEYKKAFHDNLIDGRMVNLLTIDELMSLGISSQVTQNEILGFFFRVENRSFQKSLNLVALFIDKTWDRSFTNE